MKNKVLDFNLNKRWIIWYYLCFCKEFLAIIILNVVKELVLRKVKYVTKIGVLKNAKLIRIVKVEKFVMKITIFVELDVVIQTVIILMIKIMLVFRGTLVIDPDAWNHVVSIQIVMVPISIVILIVKFVLINVQKVSIVVKDTNVQAMVNVWNLAKIVKIVLKDNIAMKMESIADWIAVQIKIVPMVNFAPKMDHVNQDVHVTMIVLKETPVINQDAWKLVASIQIVKVPISIVILIIKYAMTNVRMMIIVVKDINVQELVNAWKPVKIIKIVITDNIVMKMKSIAK